jgi:hypothetical protein
MMGGREGGEEASQHTTVQQHAAEGIAVKYDLVFIFLGLFFYRLEIKENNKKKDILVIFD